MVNKVAQSRFWDKTETESKPCGIYNLKGDNMFKTVMAKAFSGLAHKAVNSAEENFGAGKGIAKKRFALNFVLARVPISEPFRTIFENLLIELIGIAVEKAVAKLGAS